MPLNLYKCEKCGHVFESEDQCLDCENKHDRNEKSARIQYTWEYGGVVPKKIRILIPIANNKQAGRWAEYKLADEGSVYDSDPAPKLQPRVTKAMLKKALIEEDEYETYLPTGDWK